MELSPKQREMRSWLLSDWTEKLSVILEAMTDQRPVIKRPDNAKASAAPAIDGPIWSQTFALSEEPAIWVAAPLATCVDLGRRTLQAAGVELAESADSQNTYLEILSQSMSALGQSISALLACKAAATESEQLKELPLDQEWSRFRFITRVPSSIRSGLPHPTLS